MNNKILLLILVSVFISACGNNGGGIKPITPYNESTNIMYVKEDKSSCDEVKRSNKRLYGLCNAYCYGNEGPTELIVNDNGTVKITGKTRGSLEILENYNKLKKEEDPLMPCINYESACPVFSNDDLNSIINKVDNNYRGETVNYNDWINGEGLFAFSFLGEFRPDWRPGERWSFAFVDLDDFVGGYTGGFLSIDLLDPSQNIIQFSQLTLEDARECNQMIKDLQDNFLFGETLYQNGVIIENQVDNQSLCTSNCPQL